jgi:hypothetical protein
MASKWSGEVCIECVTVNPTEGGSPPELGKAHAELGAVKFFETYSDHFAIKCGRRSKCEPRTEPKRGSPASVEHVERVEGT